MKRKELVLFLIITCALFEFVFDHTPNFWIMVNERNPDRFWRARFIEKYEAGTISQLPLYTIHSTRGWTLKPNVRLFESGIHISTNERGVRSATPYIRDGHKTQVLIVGDSFTFGNGLDDRMTWAQILEDKLPHSQVINLGVDGYGIGQMLITLRETVREYRPHIVVCAFIDDDLGRNLLNFRDYKKPKFELSGGVLSLPPYSIGSMEETYRETRLIHTFESISLFNFRN